MPLLGSVLLKFRLPSLELPSGTSICQNAKYPWEVHVLDAPDAGRFAHHAALLQSLSIGHNQAGIRNKSAVTRLVHSSVAVHPFASSNTYTKAVPWIGR